MSIQQILKGKFTLVKVLISRSLALTPVLPPPTISSLRKQSVTSDTPSNNTVSQIEPQKKKDITFESRPQVIDARHVASIHKRQHLTICSLEMHVNSRGNLHPNPLYDAVSMIVCTFKQEELR